MTQIREDTEKRCFEARREADFWAANCKETKTEQEIIEEANKRYNSFFERDHFIKEAEEVFMLKEYRKKAKRMTQEEKQLVLIELCTRLPYGLHVCIKEGEVSIDVDTVLRASDIHDWLTIPSCQNITFAPYLRPISSMTEEERSEYDKLPHTGCGDLAQGVERIDWLNKKGFDYRGLISMGLALKAKEGMYSLGQK